MWRTIATPIMHVGTERVFMPRHVQADVIKACPVQLAPCCWLLASTLRYIKQVTDETSRTSLMVWD